MLLKLFTLFYLCSLAQKTIAQTSTPIVNDIAVPVIASTTVPVIASTTVPVIATTTVPVIATTTVPVIASTAVPAFSPSNSIWTTNPTVSLPLLTKCMFCSDQEENYLAPSTSGSHSGSYDS